MKQMRIDVLGVGFDNLTLDEAVAEGMRLINEPGAHYVVTPNPEIVEVCREDAEANQAVNGADVVIPDGIGVIYGAKILGTPLKLRETYPGLIIAGTHDGYFQNDEPIVADIRASMADVVFVCLGAPKQEKWIVKNGEATGAHLLLGLGGSLDVFAGVVQRAPEIFTKTGMEWFYRLLKQPSRIGRMMRLPLFIVHAVGEKGKGGKK